MPTSVLRSGRRFQQTLLFLLALGASTCVHADAPQRFTPEQLREDVQIARQALEEAHGGIYRYAPKAVIDRKFDTAQQGLTQAGDGMALYRVLAPAVASIACGHTAVLLSADMRRELDTAKLLPLDVKVIGGRLFILRDYASEGALAGREITAINGMPSATILATLSDGVPGDGAIATGRSMTVARKFRELLFTRLAMHDNFALTLAAAGGAKASEVRLTGQLAQQLAQSARQLYPQDQHSKRFAALTFADEGRVAQLKIFNFIDREEDDNGANLLQGYFEAIAAKGSKSLILDLRDNGGGEDALGKLLLSYLIDQPFRYYDTLTINRTQFAFERYAEHALNMPTTGFQPRPDGRLNMLKHPNLGVQQVNRPTFAGQVLVLMNGASFSTTAEFISQAHDRHRATFIGEESGGGYYGNSSGHDAVLVLPNTKLRVAIPLVTYQLALTPGRDPSHGVLPDYPVQRSIEDYLLGRDPEMALALDLAHKRQAGMASLP